MADEQQAQETPEETPAAPMPSAEQTDSAPVEEEKVEEQSSQQEPSEKEPELPEGAKERTKQEFEKLNERLRAEKQKRMEMERVYQSLKPQTQLPQVQPIIDPESGLINEAALTDLQQRALAAEQAAKQAVETAKQRELEHEESEMFASYPELDPNESNKFDEAFSHHVAAIKLHSMVQPDAYGGKQLSGKEAADYVRKYVPAEKLKAEGAQEALEKLTPKEQASLEATGNPGRRNQTVSLDDLRKRTRKGDQDAIVQRLNLMKPQG